MPVSGTVPSRRTTPSVSSVSGRAAGGSAASGHTPTLQNAGRPASGRFTGTGLLSRCAQGVASMGKASGKSSEVQSSPSHTTPAINAAKGIKSLSTGSKTGESPTRASPTGGVVPGRAVAAPRSGGGASLLTGAGQPAAGATSVATRLGKNAEEAHERNTSLSPLHTRPTPQLPSQRNAARTTGGHAYESGQTRGGSRVTATLQAVNRGLMSAGMHESESDAEGGYTYLPINMDYPGLKLVNAEPPIYTVDNFLTDDECARLIETAGPLLQRSKTHAAAGSEATKGRTSLTCHLAKKVYPCPIMLQKIQKLTNKPFGHMELPQVARYASSQRYVEHYDGVDPHTEAGRAFCASGGQRVATVLMYLNDVGSGGATRFKRLDIEVKPEKGKALVFFPGFMNGELDTDALHAGMPAVDTKWVSQVWIRQSFREDGQPSSAVPIEDQSLTGPLHEGLYKGLSIAGNDVHEAVMTFAEAKAFAAKLPNCQGFTYEAKERYPEQPTRVWFKSKIDVLYNDDWWTWSTGFGM